MKIVYNWLKDFVDLKAPAAEVASRLALSGTNIAGVENGPHGPVIETDLTSNRPDCLGHYGISREIAAVFRLPLKPLASKPAENGAKTAEAVSVEIQSPELCGRFTARVIRGVKIQPSPPWLRERLEAAGVSSINNVVDATNYVMLELAHPLHAFDCDKVRGPRVLVRRSGAQEKIRTLDGIERALPPGVCLVCDGDGSRPVGIAGIMGGAETEISFSTKNILIECAWFDPLSVRRSSRALKLFTDASTRFGRGADPEMAEFASRRCAELILQLAGGELLAGVVDVYPGKRAPKKLTLRRSEILRIVGADVPDKEVEAILSALGFAPIRTDVNRGSADSLLAVWECTQPPWRADVDREIDLVEEVARVHGLDNFPPRFPVSRRAARQLPHAEAEERLRERLAGLGYREILTIPHVAEERNELFRPADAAPARLANPLSEEAGVLRSTGIVTAAAALEWNLNHGQRNARLFEICRHYRLAAGQPVETPVLVVAATGEAQEKSVAAEEPARAFSFSDLKGDLDAVGALAGRFRWQPGGADWLHPARCGRLFLHAEELGVAGSLARRVAERLKLRQEVFLAEIRLDPVYAAMQQRPASLRFDPLPRFPAVERDFSLLLADGTNFSDVAAAIRSLGIAEIASIEAVDLYRGKNVPAGKYSLLVRVVFQSAAGTFTDAQIADFSARIVAALESQLGAHLRAQ